MRPLTPQISIGTGFVVFLISIGNEIDFGAALIFGIIAGVFLALIIGNIVDKSAHNYTEVVRGRITEYIPDIEDMEKIEDIDVAVTVDELEQMELKNAHKIGELREKISDARNRLQSIRLNGRSKNKEYGGYKSSDVSLDNWVDCFFCCESICRNALVCIHCGYANAHNAGQISKLNSAHTRAEGSDVVSSKKA